MSLLNLSLPEFLAIFSTLSAVVVTLYLLDRSRRKVITSSLRFWKPAGSSPQQTQKRRIQQPWSLLLQLLSLALLLLAIAQFQFGPRLRGRDHILLLDTSAWMGARTPHGTLMDDSRRLALQYVRSLPRRTVFWWSVRTDSRRRRAPSNRIARRLSAPFAIRVPARRP